MRLATPMLFALGFIAQFTIGGLSGVMHSIVPADTQQTDTYFVVAHFHYVLFGGLVFAIFGGFYYWWPKVFGKMLNEKMGKLNFWLMVIGFNLTFFPMHFLGFEGEPRRTYTYPTGMGWDTLNLLATIGAFIIALSVLVFLVNVIFTSCGAVSCAGGPVGRAHARVDAPRRRRPSTTSRRSRSSRTATSSGTASTPRTTKAGW